MMRFFTLVILYLLSSLLAFAQNYQTIRGQLVQLSDSSPVYNAHIYFDKTNFGTTTNEDGHFAFHFTENEKKSKVQISCIGYKPDSISISKFQNESLTIFIEEDRVFLSEIVVTPIDPKSILEKAIDNISLNYPKEKISKNVYYKESVRQNEKPIRLLEVVATIVSDGFSDSRQNPDKYDLFIDQKRPGFNKDETFEGANGIGVLHGLLWTEKYLNKRKLKKYTFSYEGKTNFKSHEVYKIKVNLAKESNSETEMYIRVDDFAIVAFRESLKKSNNEILKPDHQFRFLAFDLYVDFKQHNDGYWYIHTIDDRRESISHDGIISKTIRYIRTASVNIAQGSNEKNRIKRDTDLYKYPTEFDPEFWKYYNAPLETEEELKVKQDFIE